MKNATPSKFDSLLSGLSTPALAIAAIIVTLYAYGAVQNWGFIDLSTRDSNLRWERDFVDHLDKCTKAPSTLEMCGRAIQKTLVWVKSLEGNSSSLQLPEIQARSVTQMQAWAVRLAGSIPAKKESEATLRALNAWYQQMDPYSKLSPLNTIKPEGRSWELLSLENRGGGHYQKIRISNFSQAGMCREIKTALKELEVNSSIRGVKIDIRGNPGGLVDEALCVGDLFVLKGQVLATFERSPIFSPFQVLERHSLVEWFREKIGVNNIVRRSQGGMVFTKPVEIVMDRNSASSAEIFAASLKDLGRARLIGERTYGKSSIQIPKRFFEIEGVQAMLTTYKWYRPIGTTVDATQGITPDLSLNL